MDEIKVYVIQVLMQVYPTIKEFRWPFSGVTLIGEDREPKVLLQLSYYLDSDHEFPANAPKPPQV